MNLVGFLSPNSWTLKLFLTSFLLIPASAQITQKTDPTEQTSFSMEFPFERPAALSEAAKRALATDRSIADVMKDDGLTIETIPKDWFTASEVHLGPKNETDLVVMGLGISLGPYSAGFWILRQTSEGYEIVLAMHTHDVTLLDSSTNGPRDIEAGVPTLGAEYSDTYRFDGHRYKTNPLVNAIQSSVFLGESEFASVIRGVITDEASFPLSNAHIELSCPEKGYTNKVASIQSRADGGFQLQTILLGPCKVSIVAPGFAPVQISIVGSDKPAPVDLGTIRLRISCTGPGVVCDEVTPAKLKP